MPKLCDLPKASSIIMIREAQFSVVEVLTGMSCPLHARGPPLSSKMADILLGAMALEPLPYAKYWARAVGNLDIAAAKTILSTAYLLVTYPRAAPVPPASYREALEGLLRDLGARIPTPGDRPQDFPADLTWELPSSGKRGKSSETTQPLARKTGLPNPPLFEDDKAVFSTESFAYLHKKKFADRCPVSGVVTEWKIMEITDKHGPLTARIQKLTNKGCVGHWKGPFYIRDIALNHWLYLEYMKEPAPHCQKYLFRSP